MSQVWSRVVSVLIQGGLWGWGALQKLSSETHNSKAKVIWKSFELDTNASQACFSLLILWFPLHWWRFCILHFLRWWWNSKTFLSCFHNQPLEPFKRERSILKNHECLRIFTFFGVLLLFTLSMLLTVKHFPNSLNISWKWQFVFAVQLWFWRPDTWMLSQTWPVSKLCLLKVQVRTKSRTVMFSSPGT